MLNKNQSSRKNLWKYAFIFPVLIAFMLYFQVKMIAQEKAVAVGTVLKNDPVKVRIDKNSTDADLKSETKRLKSEGITLKIAKVKRNGKGEITAIKVSYKDQNGHEGATQVDGNEPIEPIVFYKNNQTIGFSAPDKVKVYAFHTDREDEGDVEDDNNSFGFAVNDGVPEAPEAPELPEGVEAPEVPEAPEPPQQSFSYKRDKHIVVKTQTDGGEPVIMVDGKVISNVDADRIIAELDPKLVKVMKEKNRSSFGVQNADGAIVIDTKKLRTEAMQQAKDAMEKVKVQMERSKVEMTKSKKIMQESRSDRAAEVAEMAKVKAEMLKARDEMLKARAEMQKAKADYEAKTSTK